MKEPRTKEIEMIFQELKKEKSLKEPNLSPQEKQRIRLKIIKDKIKKINYQEANISYFLKNPERVREIRRKSYLKNKGKRKEYFDKWKKENPERWKEISRKAYQKRKEKQKLWYIDYYKRNKEKILNRKQRLEEEKIEKLIFTSLVNVIQMKGGKKDKMTFEIYEKKQIGIKKIGFREISITKSYISFGDDVSNELKRNRFVEIHIDKENKRVGFKPTDEKANGFSLKDNSKFHSSYSLSVKLSNIVPKGRYLAYKDNSLGMWIIDVKEIARK